MGELFTPVHFIVLLFIPCFLAVLVTPYWMIFKKAGFPGALALLIWVPLINLIVLYVVAFSQWKVIPAPDYSLSYPPPPTYPPAYPNQSVGTGYSVPGGYNPAPPSYPPAPEPPRQD